MKKIVSIAACICLVFSCKKDLSSLNIDQKNPSVVPSNTLFSNAQLNMINAMADANVNNNIFRLITQQWTQTTYTDESNYDLTTRAIPDGWWGILYRDCLRDFEEAKMLVPSDVTEEAVQKNQVAIVDINQVYVYAVLISTFGDIPYTQALDAEILFPSYDDAKTVYYQLLDRLDADIAALDVSADGFRGADILYDGDVAKWKKFANSLKIIMGILLSDSDAEKARAVVESAYTGAFASNDDNALFTYLDAPPNANPVWVNLVQSGRDDFVPASTIIDLLGSLNDPRLSRYFTTDASGGYSGGVPGDGNSFPAFSHVTADQLLPQASFVLLDYAQVKFALAEAAARGFAVGGTATEHYNDAITASVLSWGGSSAEATTYLAQPSVAYATAAGDFKEKIARQEYIALYNRGFDAWTLLRHLDYPDLPVPAQAQSQFPVRFTYPILEQNINTSNYNNAASAIGGDAVTTKIFWDVF